MLLFQLVIMLLWWPKIQCYKLELCLHRGVRVLCAPSALPNFNSKVPIHVATSGMKLSSDLKKQIEEKVGSVLDKVGRNVFSAHVSLQTNNFRDNGNREKGIVELINEIVVFTKMVTFTNS